MAPEPLCGRETTLSTSHMPPHEKIWFSGSGMGPENIYLWEAPRGARGCRRKTTLRVARSRVPLRKQATPRSWRLK